MKIPPLCGNFSQSRHVQKSGLGTSNCPIELKFAQLIELSVTKFQADILNDTGVIDKILFQVSWLSRSVKVLTALCFCFELFVISFQLAFPVLHSSQVHWLYTHHTPAATVVFPVRLSLYGCMLLCLKSKFFKEETVSNTFCRYSSTKYCFK